MCITTPYKVISTDPDIMILVEGEEVAVSMSLVDVKKGDFVISQNGVIITKVPSKEAKELLKMFSIYKKKED